MPGDFFDQDVLAAFADGGLDLAAAYLAAEVAPRSHEYFHHVLNSLAEIPLGAVPPLLEAIRRTAGDVSQWGACAFWLDEGWKEVWVGPLLDVLRFPVSEARLWAVESLGRVGDTQSRWIPAADPRRKDIQAGGLAGDRRREVGEFLRGVILHDPEKEVRNAARRAVELIGV